MSIKRNFLISPEDEKLISERKWHLRPDGYLEASFNRKKVLMHRFITNAPKGMTVDHINRIKHDNRRENLRICTHKENLQNLNTTPAKCIYFTKGAWQAAVQYRRARKYLGRYKTQEEALSAVKEYKKELQAKIDSTTKINQASTGAC